MQRTYYTCTYTAYTRRRFFSVTITISKRLMSKRERWVADVEGTPLHPSGLQVVPAAREVQVL